MSKKKEEELKMDPEDIVDNDKAWDSLANQPLSVADIRFELERKERARRRDKGD